MEAIDYFGVRPEHSRFGDIAHDLEIADMMFSALIAYLPEAHGMGRLEQWRRAAHSLIDLLGDSYVIERNPSAPVVRELAPIRAARRRREAMETEARKAAELAAARRDTRQDVRSYEVEAVSEVTPEPEPEIIDAPAPDQSAESAIETAPGLFARLRKFLP